MLLSGPEVLCCCQTTTARKETINSPIADRPFSIHLQFREKLMLFASVHIPGTRNLAAAVRWQNTRRQAITLRFFISRAAKQATRASRMLNLQRSARKKQKQRAKRLTLLRNL